MKQRIVFSVCIAVLTCINGWTQSQSELLKAFTADKLIPASNNAGKLEVKTKEWPIRIERNGNNISKIILMRAGILEEVYEPDVPGYSSYFYSATTRICYLNGVFIYYKMSANRVEISYVLGTSANELQNQKLDKLSVAATDYWAAVRNQQADAKNNLKEDLAAQKEKEKLANSIKGKNIQKLEIVWLSNASETGMQSKIRFGVKATDNTRNVFSTDNLGGKTAWEDFEITCKGAVPGDEYLTVDTDGSKIPNDQVELSVKSRHHPNLIAKSSIRLAYKTPVRLSYPGANGCPPLVAGTGTSGGAAPSATLNVCNSPDGNYVLIEVKINGQTLHRVKLAPGVPFYLDITGGPGCSGRSTSNDYQGGKGGNGGNGGSVTINKSGSLRGDNITVYTEGGRGGNGGKGSGISGPAGSNGRSGTKSVSTSSINLNF